MSNCRAMDARGPAAARIWRGTAILCAFLFAATIVYLNRGFYHDDAYITLRYARNLLQGLGVVWNPGERVQGYTNFLYLLLLSVLGALGADLVWASRVVGAAAFAALLGILFLFGLAVRGDRGTPFWHLPVVLVATSFPMAVWSLGGLEGTLFALLVTGGSLFFLLATAASESPRLYAASGVSLGLCFLTRPDGAVFILTALGGLLWAVTKGAPRARVDLAAFAAGALAVGAPYVLWQLSYYGDVVPNTFYAKMGTPLSTRLHAGLRYVGDFAARPPFLPVLVACCLAYAARKRFWSPQLTHLTLSVSAYLLFILSAGGDHAPLSRLALPLVPLMGVLAALALSPCRSSGGRALAICLTIALMAVPAVQVFAGKLEPQTEDPAAFFGTIVGKYIERAWPEGSLIALHTAGSTPYYGAKHRYVDMLGLNDRTIGRRSIRNLELPWQGVPGHLKGDGAYVLARRPDFIILGPAEGTVAARPWFLSDLELSRDPRFGRDYSLSRVLLDRSGRPAATGDGILFTYYRKVDGSEGRSSPWRGQ